MWNQAVDIDAEESRETHPHLRLLEHVLPEASWVVSLSETLMLRRLFPAIDVTRCRSQYEEKLLSAAITEKLLLARGALPRHDPVKVHLRVMDALDKSVDLSTFVVQLTEMNAVAIEAEKLISERAEP